MVVFKKSKYYSEPAAGDPDLNVSPLLARALRARGAVTPEQIARFLDPRPDDFHDPFLLPDMKKAAERIRLALDTRERICIFGDYDVDGICATAMLTDCFRRIGADVCYHIPSRSEEGYGMSAAAVERLYDEGVGLIITVDNGISAANEIRRCTELGIDVIVTDHHIPPEELPECCAVVCHTVPGSRYPGSILCGAGIAFKLLHAVFGLDTAMRYISLAGLASVADVVPLLDENRILVKLGLNAINAGECPKGLLRLLESIPTAKRPYNACNLGFAVAPRLNASGRMSDASIGVELFLADDPAAAEDIISELNRLNELRQQDEADILGDALAMLRGADLSDTRAIILMKREWNGGVIGIAASRILEMFHRPTILFCEANGVLKGSSRSIDGVNIHEALSHVSDCFLRFGGHAKAAGITMEEGRFEEFKTRLNAHLKEAFPDSAFAAVKGYEFEIPLEEISGELIEDISRMAPFGECNPSPVFRTRGVQLGRLRRFGMESQHTRMEVHGANASLEAVWFCSSPYFKGLLSSERVDMLYSPAINRWCGEDGIQLRIKWAQQEQPQDIEAFIESSMWNFCDALIENSCPALPEETFTPERTDLSLPEIYSRHISGTLVLVFSPDGARRALRELAEGDMSVELCFGSAPDSPVADNALLIAPKLSCLQSCGAYRTVVFYDEPPFPGTVTAVSMIMGGAEKLALAPAGRKGSAAFTETALRFPVDREFMGECYRLTMASLARADLSFEELTMKITERTCTARYSARFALRVFMELGYIAYNERGSVSVGSIHPAKLTDSRLFAAVLEMRSKI